MMRALFDYHLEQLGDEQAVVDWLAGMTDRYAIREFENLSVPQGF
jgi:dGTP triphosphohydrolase